MTRIFFYRCLGVMGLFIIILLPNLIPNLNGQIANTALVKNGYINTNFELIARSNDKLFQFWKDSDGWHQASEIPLENKVVDGNPALIQSTVGTKGNFELAIPNKESGFFILSRLNDRPNNPWTLPALVGATGGHIDALSLIQSNYGEPKFVGNLEVIARTGDKLVQFWREFRSPNVMAWNGPVPIQGLSGVSGIPSVIQSSYGDRGNFELAVPRLDGGFYFLYRNNDEGGVWSSPETIGEDADHIDSLVLIQSNFGDPKLEGNLEVIARTGDKLVQFWRESDNGAYVWRGPAPLEGSANALGDISLIQSTFGQKGNFELAVPRPDKGFNFYWRDNDNGNRWSAANPVATDSIHMDSLSLIQSNFADKHRHLSNEAINHVRYPDGSRGDKCQVAIDIFGPWGTSDNVGGTFPTWVNLESQEPVVLEGKVLPGSNWESWPHVAWQDTPYLHYTHDMTFKVKPDDGYGYLLPTKIDPRTGAKYNQEAIEVEWETGLAASNDGNICSFLNSKGISCGFFSAGHKLGDLLWAWPTIGDRVHVDGNWVWDRGHPPASSEIHPPRLVAVQRDLPSFINTDPDRPAIFATKADVFASGDGGGLWNNRNLYPFVQSIPMNGKDYSFTIDQNIPPPSPNSKLRVHVVKHNGDNFSADPIIKVFSHGTGWKKNPFALVVVPWHSAEVSNSAVFGRTFYLYWDEGSGAPSDYKYNLVRVKMESINIHNNLDNFDGDWRVFGEVGGQWFFMNDFALSQDQVNDDGILGDGLGDVGEEAYPGPSTSPNSAISRFFDVIVPDEKGFRIHTSGWDADASNDIFGRIFDQNRICDKGLESDLNDKVFGGAFGGAIGNAFAGCLDDPIGEIHAVYSRSSAVDFGNSQERISIPSQGDIIPERVCGDTNPNNSYSIVVTFKTLH
jgi:hypothetical protein